MASKAQFRAAKVAELLEHLGVAHDEACRCSKVVQAYLQANACVRCLELRADDAPCIECRGGAVCATPETTV